MDKTIQCSITEMSAQLKKCIDDSESRISNCVSEKCDVIEEHIKHYINTSVFAYIDNIFENMGLHKQGNRSQLQSSQPIATEPMMPELNDDNNNTGTTTGSTQETAQSTTVSVLSNEIQKQDVTHTSEDLQERDPTSCDELQAATVPCGLNTANSKHPIHDVYIGGTCPTTTEDDIRNHLHKIGVINVSRIVCISGNNPTSSEFRVTIHDNTIKNNVYNEQNFKKGIVVTTYRSHERNINQARRQIASHNSSSRPPPVSRRPYQDIQTYNNTREDRNSFKPRDRYNNRNNRNSTHDHHNANNNNKISRNDDNCTDSSKTINTHDQSRNQSYDAMPTQSIPTYPSVPQAPMPCFVYNPYLPPQHAFPPNTVLHSGNTTHPPMMYSTVQNSQSLMGMQHAHNGNLTYGVPPQYPPRPQMMQQ